MSATLIVRAVLSDPADRQAFERWYDTEHLPQARAAFDATSAWRGWSDVEASVHYALYRFPTLGAARAVSGSEAMAALIAEFDRTWGDRVTRTRDIVACAQTLPNPT